MWFIGLNLFKIEFLSNIKVSVKMNAVKSGRLLEKLVHKELSKVTNVKVTPQYQYKDIFGAKARVDFFVETQQSLNYNKLHFNKFFIECKNQNVPGSLDQKFQYYIENIRQNKYEGNPLIFVLNTNGIRSKVLEYLVSNTSKYNFMIVDTHNIDKLNNIIHNQTYESVFIKKIEK